MFNFILGQIIVESFQFPLYILQDGSDHSDYGNHQRSKGHGAKVENCGVPKRSPDSTAGQIFFLVEGPVPLGEHSGQHHLSEGAEEKHSPDNKIKIRPNQATRISVSFQYLRCKLVCLTSRVQTGYRRSKASSPGSWCISRTDRQHQDTKLSSGTF